MVFVNGLVIVIEESKRDRDDYDEQRRFDDQNHLTIVLFDALMIIVEDSKRNRDDDDDDERR